MRGVDVGRYVVAVVLMATGHSNAETGACEFKVQREASILNIGQLQLEVVEQVKEPVVTVESEVIKYPMIG